MKYLRLVLFVLGFQLCGSGLCADPQTYSIPATVNGKPIVNSEVLEAIRGQEQLLCMQISDPEVAKARILQVRAGALFTLIEEHLVLSEFEQSRGVIKPQYVDDDINNLIRQRFGGDRARFLRELATAGMTYTGFREQRERMMIIAALRSNRVKNLPPPTPAQVEAWYRKNSDQFRGIDHIKFSTITIPKFPAGDAQSGPESQRKLAEDIQAQTASGTDFAQMARTHSTDTYARSGGDRGLQERSLISKEIADVAFALKDGAVSKVVDLGPNYVIIFCECRELGKVPPLDEVRPEVEKRVVAQMARDAVNRWLSGLASRAVIQPENVRDSFQHWLETQQNASLE